MKIRMRSDEKVIKVVDVGAPNLWGHFKDWILEICDEVSGKKGGGKVKGIHGSGMKS